VLITEMLVNPDFEQRSNACTNWPWLEPSVHITTTV
jgi:hypothetical protein